MPTTTTLPSSSSLTRTIESNTNTPSTTTTTTTSTTNSKANTPKVSTKVTSTSGIHIISSPNSATVRIQFKAAQLLYPGVKQTVTSTNIIYSIYALDIDAITALYPDKDILQDTLNNMITTSTCGLQYAHYKYINVINKIILPTSYTIDKSGAITMALPSSMLPINKLVNLTLTAICDAYCLRDASKYIPTPYSTICGGDVDCTTQYTVYNTTYTTITAATIDPSSSQGASWVSKVLIAFGVITSIGILLCIVSVVVWMRVNGLWDTQPDYYRRLEMYDNDLGAHEASGGGNRVENRGSYKGMPIAGSSMHASIQLHDRTGVASFSPLHSQYTNNNQTRNSFSGYPITGGSSAYTSSMGGGGGGYIPPSFDQISPPSTTNTTLTNQVTSAISTISDTANKVTEKLKNVAIHASTTSFSTSSTPSSGYSRPNSGVPSLYSGMTVMGQANAAMSSSGSGGGGGNRGEGRGEGESKVGLYAPLTTHLEGLESDDEEGEEEEVKL